MIENFRMRVFRSVAQHLNFSRAAEELLLSQPAVTQQIKALEDELGMPLFDRGGGHIQLTSGGKALLPYAEKLRELGAEAVTASRRPAVNRPAILPSAPRKASGSMFCPSSLPAFLGGS